MEVMEKVLDFINEEYGVMEEGDEHVVVLNDATVVLMLENRQLRCHFIGGQPDRLNIDSDFFEVVE